MRCTNTVTKLACVHVRCQVRHVQFHVASAMRRCKRGYVGQCSCCCSQSRLRPDPRVCRHFHQPCRHAPYRVPARFIFLRVTNGSVGRSGPNALLPLSGSQQHVNHKCSLCSESSHVSPLTKCPLVFAGDRRYPVRIAVLTQFSTLGNRAPQRAFAVYKR